MDLRQMGVGARVRWVKDREVFNLGMLERGLTGTVVPVSPFSDMPFSRVYCRVFFDWHQDCLDEWSNCVNIGEHTEVQPSDFEPC